MKALLLIAHGSNNPDSNAEIYELTALLRTRIYQSANQSPNHTPNQLSHQAVASRFDWVECAFLELTDPDIATAIGSLVTEGATVITVLPYFLAKGHHVDRDIPEQIADLQIRFPEITVNTMPHVGKAENMIALLLEHLHLH